MKKVAILSFWALLLLPRLALSDEGKFDDLIGKTYWPDTELVDLHAGPCGARKAFAIGNFSPSDDLSFVVKRYVADIPYTNSTGKWNGLELEFSDGGIACIDALHVKGLLQKCSQTSITTELEAAGIKPGCKLWLKYPLDGVPGLTELTVTKIKPEYGSARVNFSYGHNGMLVLNLHKASDIWDSVYAKFPVVLANLKNKTKAAIARGQVFLGMSTAEAMASWGIPADINRTVGSWGVHEQWVYSHRNAYLYFKNGKLTSWQD